MTPEEEEREQESVDFLTAMLGDESRAEEVRRVLRKHKGDVQKAADILLGGDRGVEDNTANTQEVDTFTGPAESSGRQIIDLTQEDDKSRPTRWDNVRGRQEVKFGPSDRAPHADWQMVTTSKATTESRDDHSLKHAIQASLADFQNDELEMFTAEDSVREGGRPVALRSQSPEIAYAVLVTQALFMVPQVRESISQLRLPDEESPLWRLVELFTNLDLAQLSAIVDNDFVPAFNPTPWDGTTETLGPITVDFIRNFANFVESQLDAQRKAQNEDAGKVHLFNFTHTKARLRADNTFKVERGMENGSVVNVELNDDSPQNLVAKLAANLTRIEEDSVTNEIILEPSALVMFQLQHSLQQQPSSGPTMKSPPELFAFPKSFYLDRFMSCHLKLAHEKRVLEHDMRESIATLSKQKEFLTSDNGRDTLKDLRITLHYYEHVAESRGDHEREQAILRTREKLQRIITAIVRRLDEIERQIEKLQSEVTAIYDCPELQLERYDLRAVLMHTGLPGRKQIYSYVLDDGGVWWKMLDHSVTEVPEETVLTDPAGLHLGAGPYLLIYSRHLLDDTIKVPIEWPTRFVYNVAVNNERFLTMLPPEAAGKASVAHVRGGAESQTVAAQESNLMDIA